MKKKILAILTALVIMLVPQVVVLADGINAYAANLSPSVIISSYKADGKIASGEGFKLTVVLKNTSKAIDVQNVLIRISGGEAFSINNGTDSVYTDKISKDSTYSFTKNMMCSAAQSGTYPINVSVTYEYFDEGERASGSNEFSISLNASAEKEQAAASLTPQVLITGFSYGSESISGGKNFKLSFNLQNNSSSITVKNVIVKLGGGEAFIVADGTDTIAINSIGAGATVPISKEFQCLGSARSGVYQISAAISYEYFDEGTKAAGSSDLTMSIPVIQPDIISFEGIELADKTITVEQENDCAFQIINSGQTKISNGRVILKTENGTELASAFIGNIESGTQFSSNYTLPVTFNDLGSKTLILVLEYDNENFEKKSIETSFKVTVDKYFDPYEDIDGIDTVPAQQDKSPVVTIICAVAGVAVAVVVIIVAVKITKKRRLKKGSEIIDEEI